MNTSAFITFCVFIITLYIGCQTGVYLTERYITPCTSDVQVAYVIRVDASGATTLDGTAPYDCENLEHADNTTMRVLGNPQTIGTALREACNLYGDVCICPPAMPVTAFIRSPVFPDGLCVHYIIE